MKHFIKLLAIVLIGLLVRTPFVFAMTSTNFSIPWDNVNSGGLDNSSSTNFSSRDTIGDNSSGTSTSSNYQLSAGYRAPEGANTLSFQVHSAATSPVTSYTAFSDGGSTVTVSSATGFSEGDMIAVVENVGFGQLVAVGKISNIAGLVITVDGWKGDGGSMNAVPAGGNDNVYLLSSNSIAFGTVSAGTAYTSVVGTAVITNVSSGYSLYLSANSLLKNGASQTIAPVTDGAVTLGSEEFGTDSTGGLAVNPGTDLGVTTTQRVIQTNAFATGALADMIAMTYKLSVSSSTNSGSYTQTVYYTLTANY